MNTRGKSQGGWLYQSHGEYRCQCRTGLQVEKNLRGLCSVCWLLFCHKHPASLPLVRSSGPCENDGGGNRVIRLEDQSSGSELGPLSGGLQHNGAKSYKSYVKKNSGMWDTAPTGRLTLVHRIVFGDQFIDRYACKL